MRLAVIILVSLALGAGADTVVTRDGQTITGKARLDKDQAIIAPATGKSVTVLMGKLASLSFDAPAAKGPMPATQPATWASFDIGTPRTEKGRAEVASDRIILFDSANGVRSPKKGNDSFFFFHQRVRGDVTLTARLRVVDDTRLARAGLMMRGNLNTDAASVALLRSSIGQSLIFRRPSDGAPPEEGQKSEHRIAGAVWLRLERKGYTFTSSESWDGKNWKPMGTTEVPMEEEIVVGLAAASGGIELGRTVFDNVTLSVNSVDAASIARVPKGIMTVGGSNIACDVSTLDEQRAQYAIEGKQATLAIDQVARLVFTPLLPAHEEKLAAAKGTGVLLINGDFLEGEIKGVADGQVKITSVLFGAKSLDTRREAIAVALRPTKPAKCEWEVRLADRSLLRATALKWTKDAITLSDGTLGEMTVPAGQILQIVRP